MSKAVLAWLGVLFVVAGGTLLWLGYKYTRPDFAVRASVPEIDRGYQLKPLSANEPYLTEFTLTERSGKKVGTADLVGKVSVTNFFFTTCPAECKRQQAVFDTVQREYGPQGVQFVSITCDPQIDTPSRFNWYVNDQRYDIARNGEAWWFLTGDLLYIRRIAFEYYGVPLDRFTHTEKFEVRDKWGNPRGSFSWKDEIGLVDLKRKLDELLVETEPPAEVKAAAAELAAKIEKLKAGAAEAPMPMTEKTPKAPANVESPAPTRDLPPQE
jgi:cytochrome oxidase Cu insertion factor (SCO1/SenC/PrrC family)